jgi:uncharacterized membrane protein
VLTVLLTLSYPFVIWFSQGKIEPRMLAGLVLAMALLRLVGLRIGSAAGSFARWGMIGALLLAAFAIFGNAWGPLKLYPVLVNAVMLGVFAYSLASPPSIIERFARLSEPDLPPEGVAYTRRVTQVWCGFFIVNGSIALATSLWASPAVWSLYNGVIAYVLMGLLFGGEYLVRIRVRRRRNV